MTGHDLVAEAARAIACECLLAVAAMAAIGDWRHSGGFTEWPLPTQSGPSAVQKIKVFGTTAERVGGDIV
jgi:hypothetical protein